MKKHFRKIPKFTRNLAMAAILLGSPALIHGAQNQDQDEAESYLWCPCGCNQGLGVCNHIGCPSAPLMRGEVTQYLDEGLDVDSVLARFEEKYGPTILTAPSTDGWFDLSVWLMPFAGLLAGIAGVSAVARRFRRRSSAGQTQDSSLEPVAMDRTRQRIDEELADFTPED